MRGEAEPRAQSPAAHAQSKKRVLFVCIGNSCRSQMAEAFARAYGADIMTVESAGLSPAGMIAPMTKQVLAQRNLSLDGHFPKDLEAVSGQQFDVVVNLSGHPVSAPDARVVTWTVADPIGQKEAVYQTVVSQIEQLVMSLILTLRSGKLPG